MFRRKTALVLAAAIGMVMSACSKNDTGTIIQRESKARRSSSTPAPVAAPAPSAPVQSVSLNLKVAHNQTALDNPYVFGISAFKEKVEQLSNGSIQATLYNGTMDQEESGLMKKMQAGEASIVIVSPSLVTAQNVPEVDVLSLEYLFDSFPHWASCLDGEFGTELAKIVTQKTSNNIKILGYWSAGVRNYYGKKAIRKPDDLKGMTIRISNSPVQQQFWKACGAIPKDVGWGDLYQALQDGTVDSAENDYTNFSLKKHHQTKNGHFICETEHDFTTRLMLIDGNFYDSLTAEQKKWIEEAAQYATQTERRLTFEQLSSSKAQVIADGAEIVENKDIDIAAFKKIAYPIQDQYAKENKMEHFLKLVRDAR